MVEKFGWQKKKEKMTYCYTVSNRKKINVEWKNYWNRHFLIDGKRKKTAILIKMLRSLIFQQSQWDGNLDYE